MRLYFIVFYLFISFSCFSQNTAVLPALGKGIINRTKAKAAPKDTVAESDTAKENKEPRYYYISVSTNVLVNSKGGFSKRFSPAIEVGRTYGIFDIGLANGLTNFAGSDTTHYLEFRPTINIFSKGRFSEGLCLGAGYVFGAKQGLMTEVCNSINFNISENVSLAIVQGYYLFDGTNDSRTAQYIGLSLTYNFLFEHSVNKQRKKAAIISDK